MRWKWKVTFFVKITMYSCPMGCNNSASLSAQCLSAHKIFVVIRICWRKLFHQHRFVYFLYFLTFTTSFTDEITCTLWASEPIKWWIAASEKRCVRKAIFSSDKSVWRGCGSSYALNSRSQAISQYLKHLLAQYRTYIHFDLTLELSQLTSFKFIFCAILVNE